MNQKSKFTISTTHLIMLSFLLAILLGAVLLSLPISAADGQATPFVDALFTATTATCVTGLVVVPTATSWSLFGHIVILILIQLGGLGIITVLAGITLTLNRKMGIGRSILLQDAFNLDTLFGLGAFVKKVIIGTFIVEGIGALAYMTVFVPQFGARGIWISVFTSVSAFCNAGIDIIGENSMIDYATNPAINAITCVLIVVGGLGYIVWWDLIRVFRDRKKGNPLRHLTLHSKIVLSATAVLIFGGALLIALFEWNNPQTIGNMSVFDKLQTSVFQSITTRTAGFATVPQENLSNPSAFVSLLLMFIGGSPVGTAGGIKTVTIVVLFAAALVVVRQKGEQVNMFDRSITRQAVSKAVGVCCMSFGIMFVSTVLLSAVTDASALDVVYETVSATATVGLTRNLTPSLNTLGKLIITATMYLGRVGPISLMIAFNLRKKRPSIISNPVETISVG
ncbi:MAG: potassium transporter KtrB [Oscillospiraceae bacterium]|nr:potassium transporter KtrB [Oscillospiraceae bacterium]MBQ9930379.1 potassium transporter KtrB [Oscillospiraceae bacterium]